MEPALPTGSLVFVVNKNDYQKGDIVTVRSKAGGKETVTHRIDEVVNNDETDVTMYELKGDANKIKDSEPVNKNRVLGRVVGHVPYAGRVVGFAQTQMGFVFLVVVPCTLIIYSELMTIKKELLLLIKKRRAGVSVPPPAVPAT
jgi:signal peptidase